MIIDETSMVKKKEIQAPLFSQRKYLFFTLLSLGAVFLFILSCGFFIFRFESFYRNKVYPGVKIDGVAFDGKKKTEIQEYYAKKSSPLSMVQLTLEYEDKIATISGNTLKPSYDENLAAEQALAIGRSHNFFSNLYQKWKAYSTGVNLTSIITMKTEVIDDELQNLASAINVEPEDALFEFRENKVVSFRPSKSGKALDTDEAKKRILESIISYSLQEDLQSPTITIELPVRIIQPKITTENSNNYGIKELLGKGTSTFRGSIPGRKHNVNLASIKMSGHLIAPGTEFSFNDTLGDVSASTGFQPAYIIKSGRTVLGDGGGVCQVSTTLFRAILNSGLPVTERHAHAYRVGYYEQDSPPGIDATVFAPTYDLKFKNDTDHYILVQSQIDLEKETLEFDFYGTRDDRKVEMTKPVILSQSPPLPDLYQEDPTLAKGVVKQVDWKVAGAKVNFDYTVTKGDTLITKASYFSNYQPWQSVYLQGTKE